MKVMTATISYLRNAAQKLNNAADRLEKQDGWHLYHATGMIDQAIKDAELSKRHIMRRLAENAEIMRSQTK